MTERNELIKIERKLKFHSITDEMFGSGLTLITGDFKDFVEYIDKRYDIEIKYSPTINGKYLHLTKGELDHQIIWASSLQVKELLTLNHEVGHFVFDLLNNCRSTPHSDDTDEVYEYYREYILKKIFALTKKK